MGCAGTVRCGAREVHFWCAKGARMRFFAVQDRRVFGLRIVVAVEGAGAEVEADAALEGGVGSVSKSG